VIISLPAKALSPSLQGLPLTFTLPSEIYSSAFLLEQTPLSDIIFSIRIFSIFSPYIISANEAGAFINCCQPIFIICTFLIHLLKITQYTLYNNTPFNGLQLLLLQ